MIGKTMRTITIFFLLFLFVIPACVAQQIVYEDSHVIMIGTCRTMQTDIDWNKWFYKGSMRAFGVANFDTCSLYVYQNNSMVYHTSISGGFTTVYFHNLIGVFLYTSVGFGYSRIPPFLYINVNAEKTYINN